MASNNKEFFWKNLGSGLYLTSCGNLLVNPKFSGNMVITHRNVYDSKNVNLIGKTWKECLINISSSLISDKLRKANIKFYINLDDGDCCADGIMWFQTPECKVEDDQFIYDQVATFVCFNRSEHKYIEDARRFGKKLYRYEGLKAQRCELIEKISYQNKLIRENNFNEEELDIKYLIIDALEDKLKNVNSEINFIENKR